MSEADYSVLIQALTPEEGGGFFAIVPELPGCMSDGQTAEEAEMNVRDAARDWITTAQQLGRKVPPGLRAYA